MLIFLLCWACAFQAAVFARYNTARFWPQGRTLGIKSDEYPLESQPYTRTGCSSA